MRAKKKKKADDFTCGFYCACAAILQGEDAERLVTQRVGGPVEGIDEYDLGIFLKYRLVGVSTFVSKYAK